MVTALNINNNQLDITGFPYCSDVIENKNIFIEKYRPLYNYFYSKLFDILPPGVAPDNFILRDLKNKKTDLREIIKALSLSDDLGINVWLAPHEELLEKFYDNFYVIGWLFDFTCDSYEENASQAYRND